MTTVSDVDDYWSRTAVETYQASAKELLKSGNL